MIISKEIKRKGISISEEKGKKNLVEAEITKLEKEKQKLEEEKKEEEKDLGLQPFHSFKILFL